MANISGKLNLRQLVSKVIEKDSKKYLILPIAENRLFEGNKGIYLDFQGWEIKNKNGDSKDTHLVKQSLPKEVFAAMTDDEKKAQPIIGNLIVWGGGSHSEPEPNEAPVDAFGSDDLPF